MTTVSLALTAALTVAALTLLGRSLRSQDSQDSLHALGGMTMLLAAGVSAFLYAALTS